MTTAPTPILDQLAAASDDDFRALAMQAVRDPESDFNVADNPLTSDRLMTLALMAFNEQSRLPERQMYCLATEIMFRGDRQAYEKKQTGSIEDPLSGELILRLAEKGLARDDLDPTTIGTLASAVSTAVETGSALDGDVGHQVQRVQSLIEDSSSKERFDAALVMVDSLVRTLSSRSDRINLVRLTTSGDEGIVNRARSGLKVLVQKQRDRDNDAQTAAVLGSYNIVSSGGQDRTL